MRAFSDGTTTRRRPAGRHPAAVAASALLLLAAVPALPGCLPAAAGLAGPGLTLGTTAATGRTPVDHAVSLVSGKDCSIVRRRQGLSYCREDQPDPPVTVACYRTLGDVACHRKGAAQPGRPTPLADAAGPAGDAAIAGPPSGQPGS